MDSTNTIANLIQADKLKTETRQRALKQGFTVTSGKFEGDPFETLFIKINTKEKRLLCLIEIGHEIEFDLSTNCYVFEDSANPKSFVLDYRNTIIVFKVSNFLLFF